MYSIKEKNKHLRSLNAVQHAEKDLELLRRLDPRNDQLPSLSLSPRRNAERILYILLDVATAQEIRLNRRSEEEIEQEEVETPDTETPDTGEDAEPAEVDEAVEETEPTEVQVAEEVAELVEAVEAVEAEKKSEETLNQEEPSSKKKTSTPKSTGKTSQIKTSK